MRCMHVKPWWPQLVLECVFSLKSFLHLLMLAKLVCLLAHHLKDTTWQNQPDPAIIEKLVSGYSNSKMVTATSDADY